MAQAHGTRPPALGIAAEIQQRLLRIGDITD
jgi:hypothetical protein